MSAFTTYIQNTGLVDLEGLMLNPSLPSVLQLILKNQIEVTESGLNNQIVKMTSMLTMKVLRNFDRQSEAIQNSFQQQFKVLFSILFMTLGKPKLGQEIAPLTQAIHMATQWASNKNLKQNVA